MTSLLEMRLKTDFNKRNVVDIDSNNGKAQGENHSDTISQLLINIYNTDRYWIDILAKRQHNKQIRPDRC